MKILRYILALLITTIVAGSALSTGCGSAAPIPPAEVPAPIGVSMLDGGNNIPVDSSFKYTFSQDVLTQTVDTSTFFIVKNEAQASTNKADLDTSICDPSRAIDAVVTCSSNTECSLVPTVNLDYASSYTICLTTDIRYFDGSPFEGIMATFTTEADGPLSLNDLDGATGVPIASEFRYRFQQEVESATADDSTFFIVSLGASASLNKADVIPSICVAANALDAEISCTDWSCTLSPVDVLEYGTSYAACLTGGIDYQPVTQTVGQLQIQSQAEFDGFMASFMTVEDVPPEPVIVDITSAKLVRLDGTELDLEDRPIPRAVSIKYALSLALTAEADRQAFEDAVTLVDEVNATVDGSYEWSADFQSVTFIPTHRLEYQTEYSTLVDTGSLPVFNLSKANGTGDMSFVTMTDRDIDGDGFADVITAARGVDATGVDSNNGRAYIFYGSASAISDCDLGLGCTADTIITGPDNGYLGLITTAGDVNADGYTDVIFKVSGLGQVYVLLGSADGVADCDLSANPQCIPDTILTGNDPGDGFGESISAAGDVNGDGYDDITVGAYTYNTNHGQAYVFHGSATGIADCDLSDSCIPPATITANSKQYFGYFISKAGDVNGDGYDDVIMGGNAYNSNQGRAYVFLGSETGIGDCDMSSCIPPTVITGSSVGDQLGSVSTAGDINSDGYDDVIVGAFSALGYRGQAYILLGSDTGISDCDLSATEPCAPYVTISGVGASDMVGNPAHAGDVNGDGYDDVMVGAQYANQPGDNYWGRVYLFLGPAAGMEDCDLSAAQTCIPDATFTGENTWDFLGFGLSTAGDVNGDGYDDIIASSLHYKSYSMMGRAYFFLGSDVGIADCDLRPPSTCTPDATLTGISDGDAFGGVK